MTHPRLVAHRGWPSRIPENTLPSLAAAIERGARALEIDIQLTRDGVPVLFHDRELGRCATGQGAIADFDLASLAALTANVPGRFSGRFPEARIPTLAAAVELLAEYPGVHLFVEIKRVSLERFGRPAVLTALLPVLEPLLERCTVISFDGGIVADLLAAGRCECGWIVESWDDVTFAAADELSPHYLFADVKILPPGDAPLRAWPWRLAVYVVDDAETAERLAQRGAHLVETDDIGALLDARPLWLDRERPE